MSLINIKNIEAEVVYFIPFYTFITTKKIRRKYVVVKSFGLYET